MVMAGIGKIELKVGVMAELMFEGKSIGSLGVNDDRNKLLILEAKGTEIQIQLKK